jgi:ribonuclease D
VGADSEFRGGFTKFDKTGVATLQLSTETASFIFDCIALQESEKFKKFLIQFFGDEKIEKIGHSFSSDVHALNGTFNINIVKKKSNFKLGF